MKLTDNQVYVLRLIKNGNHAFTGAKARHRVAGRARTLQSLVQAGMIDMGSRFHFIATTQGMRALEGRYP